MKSITLKMQSGMTLVELAAVLVIGLVILGVVLSNMQGVFSSAGVSEEMTNINTLYTNIRALKTSSGYGTSGTSLVSTLYAAKGIPTSMNYVSNTLYNSFGGTVAIQSTGNGFTIEYGNVPRAECVKLVTKLSKSGIFQSTKVGSASAVAGEYTPAQAGNDCQDTNSITWTSAT